MERLERELEDERQSSKEGWTVRKTGGGEVEKPSGEARKRTRDERQSSKES